jgi:hypothetical protein
MRSHFRIALAFAGLALLPGRAACATPRARAWAAPLPQKPYDMDYLSPDESDKIRDADTPAERIKLYTAFADDRLKKFDYEIHRTAPERNRDELLNNLLNGYAGCIDDASDQIDVARDKQMDVRDAVKLLVGKEKDFLDQLTKYEKDAPDVDAYRDTLDDAIDGTKEDMSDAQDALKEMLPPPVRRKQ